MKWVRLREQFPPFQDSVLVIGHNINPFIAFLDVDDQYGLVLRHVAQQSYNTHVMVGRQVNDLYWCLIEAPEYDE